MPSGNPGIARKPLIDRLVGRSRMMPSGCIEWTGKVQKRIDGSAGYGRMAIFGLEKYVHRVVYEFAKGPIPDGLAVCHTCDNRLCMNPEHMFLGTWADNLKDAAVKGRMARKLTTQQVVEIKALIASGLSNSAIAPRYGVSRSLVYSIGTGRSWRHHDEMLQAQR